MASATFCLIQALLGIGASSRQEGGHEEHREQRSSHKGQYPRSAEQEWQHDEACDGVLEQNVAIPDENEMGCADEHEESQPPDEQCRTAGIGRQVIVLDGKAYSEKEREQRERFQIDADHQYRIKRAIEPGPVTSSGRNCSKIETRNTVATLIAMTPNRAMPRTMSIAAMRSEGAIGPAVAPAGR